MTGDELEELKSIILAGLNAGNGDGEWEALVNAADILGIKYDDETNEYGR